MVKVPLSNSFLERRDGRQKFSESLGAGATHSSADLTWIRKWLEIQAPELESVELELGSCCSDFDKHVSDEVCWTRKRQFEIPFCLLAVSCPWVTSCSIPTGRLSRKRRRTDRKDFYHVPQHPNPNTYAKFIFLRTSLHQPRSSTRYPCFVKVWLGKPSHM